MLSEQEQRRFQRDLADKISQHASLDEVRILLASGAQVNTPVVQGLKPLHYAVYASNLECVRLLLVRGSDIDAVDDVGYSPMHLCAEHGNYGLLEYLINHNARVCFVDKDETDPFPMAHKSEEPLRLAIKNGHYDCAELLLQNGADPNARYFLGSEINLLNPTDAKFLRLLLMYGADPNVYDRDGLTPLMRACRHRDGMDAVNTLLEFGAYINAFALERQDFRTPLHYAILSGSVKMVSHLVAKGAKVNMNCDYYKPSPLDIAVLRDSPELVQLLLNEMANPNAVYTYIGSPLHLASCSDLTHQYEIVEMLLKAGADPNLCPSFDEGVLKSPTVEYFRSRTDYDAKIVRLLLNYGAEIIMKSPLHSPQGMLRNLVKIQDNEEIYNLVLEAGQGYSVESVERVALPTRRRMQLLNIATQPLSLAHLCRLATRKALRPLRPDKIHRLPLPKRLIGFMLYQNNLDDDAWFIGSLAEKEEKAEKSAPQLSPQIPCVEGISGGRDFAIVGGGIGGSLTPILEEDIAFTTDASTSSIAA